jgi:hypothetical protein
MYAVLTNVFRAWRNVTRAGESVLQRGLGAGGAILITLFAIPFVLGEIVGLIFLMKTTSLALVIFVVSAGLLHILFVHLMKAPTLAGRRLLDQVEGFKLFLAPWMATG